MAALTEEVDYNEAKALEFIHAFNNSYQERHKSYEDNFWATKMNLSGSSTEGLTRTKNELDAFLGNKDSLSQVRKFLTSEAVSEDSKKVLRCFERTFLCYIIEDKAALELKETIGRLESELATSRNSMDLGYVSPDDGSLVKCSSVQLRNLMRTSDSEEVRKACFSGLRGIGAFVAEQAEGFNKATLFSILDGLEERTRPALKKALELLAEEKGESALLPHNTGYFLAGDINKLKSPYFPFENAVDVWARSFAALGITYRGSTMRLDLCDRPGKYSNGFCHWPQPAWQSPDGWVPSQTNFTSLASPKAVGSGHTALVTLMHEGGHAAHFANVQQRSPLFSQERAPTSVAYAENQSMFLDSLVGDAAWQARYALSREGEPIPWSLIEQELRSTHKYQVFTLRAMLAVPYFEKRLYELAEGEVTAERIIQLADEVECDIQGGLAGRPLMSVPHILSDESAAYYHGYVLAEMSVHQTREHFMRKYGRIVDNAEVGSDLAAEYWAPGNSEPFMGLVESLTGSPLTGDAWVNMIDEDVDSLVASEKIAYDEAIGQGPKYSAGVSVDLDMRVLLVHGDEVVSDSEAAGGLGPACEQYKVWLRTLS